MQPDKIVESKPNFCRPLRLRFHGALAAGMHGRNVWGIVSRRAEGCASVFAHDSCRVHSYFCSQRRSALSERYESASIDVTVRFLSSRPSSSSSSSSSCCSHLFGRHLPFPVPAPSRRASLFSLSSSSAPLLFFFFLLLFFHISFGTHGARPY